MPLPRIAIVGRPNVGKSSLLNRLARRRVSIVDPTPGVTRDRVSVVMELDPPVHGESGRPERLVEIIDTGGYGVYTAEGGRYNEIGADLATLTPEIESQIKLAREQAAVIVFLTDAQAGITALDDTVARLLRQEGSASRVIPVVNKVDGENWVPDAMEMAALGYGEPMCISAEHGKGVRELQDELYERIATIADEPVEQSAEEIRVAIVGKRNAGKSTLINTLAGEQRVIVSEIAGTTRDSVDVRFEFDGRAMLAIDTAGLRKRKSFADDIEYYAYHRMLSAIRRGDVAILLLDATEEVSQVDQKLAQELLRQFKPTVIVVNKWDLVEEKLQPEQYIDYLTEQLRGFEFAPIVFISAKEGEGVQDAVAMAFNLYQQASHRETTGKVNRVVEGVLNKRGPSSRLGTQAKLYFASQVETNPPTIALIVNDPKLFKGRYERYLMNRLREELPFSEVPIRVMYKKRSRVPLQELKERGGQIGVESPHVRSTAHDLEE